MATTVRRVRYTYEPYLALEDERSIRREYLDSEIYERPVDGSRTMPSFRPFNPS